jgi:DNA-binding SARP family transcriptional activator
MSITGTKAPQGTGRELVPQPATWHLCLLDGWLLRHFGQPVQVASREQRLLTALALLGDRPRSHLAGVLWPESEEARAQGNLRAAVWHVQHSLPGLLTEGRGPLGLQPGVHVDVRELLDVASRVSAGTVPAEPAAALAVLSRGELLPGWYEDWTLFERERTQQLRLRALEALTDQLLSLGYVDQALGAAMAAVAIEPLRESAHRALVRVHLTIGNHADAMRVYEAFRNRLRAELGILPSAQIRALVRPLLGQTIPAERRPSDGRLGVTPVRARPRP